MEASPKALDGLVFAMATLTSLPAVETTHLILREIEGRDAGPFAGFMTQAAYQRHIAVRLVDAREVKAFGEASTARWPKMNAR